jgi:glycine oxidase
VTPPASPDVLVIGGGVIGCAIARAVARPGRVVVLADRGAIGGEASSAAAGVLSVASGADDGARLTLRRASLDRFPSLAAVLRDETGVDVELDLDGVLVPCLDEAGEAAQRAQIARRRAAGLRARWLDAGELGVAEPAVNPRARGAAFYEDDGRVACARLIEALAASARLRGAHLLPGVEVRSVERRGNRIERVRIGDAVASPGAVVLAAGAWSARIPGVVPPPPVLPVRGQMLALRPPPNALRRVVFDGDGCLTPRRSGEVLVGGTVEDSGFEKAVTPAGIRRLLDDVERIAPAALAWPVVRAWAGLRPGTSGNGPLIGRHAEIGNLVVATGHHRSGILLAPVTADTVAALLEGAAVPREAAPFGAG